MVRTRHLVLATSLICVAGCSTTESAPSAPSAPSALSTTAPSTTDAPTTTADPSTTAATTTLATVATDIVVDQQVAPPPEGIDGGALLVTYRMPGAAGGEVRATATVVIPTTPAPADGWPIIAYSPGASGLAPECAPSRSPDLNFQASFVAPIVAAGAVVVIPDGEGMVDGGRPTFRDADSQAATVLSAVRAASEIVDGVGGTWAVVGYSLGGQAAIAAAEAASMLPDIEFRGALAIAPASDPIIQSRSFDERMDGDDPGAASAAAVLKNMLLGWMVEGLTVRFPAIVAANVDGDQADELATVLRDGCVIDTFVAINALVTAHTAAGGTPATFGGLQPTWFDEPAIAAAIEANAVGSGTVAAPITIVHGPADEIVPFAATQALLDALRTAGNDVTLVETAAPNHGAFVSDAATAIARDEFVAQILAG